jgi:glucose/arabinose dehydrogenase
VPPAATGQPSNAASPSTSSVPSASQSAEPLADVPTVDLRLVADGLVAPVGLVAAPDGSRRSFVLDQPGRILILRDDRLVDRPLLDLTGSLVKLDEEYDERGLLGLAFHPDFASNGRLFVYRSVPASATGIDHLNRLSEFRVVAGNPDRVEPASERVILEFGQPQPNHSGGGLGFGPDGFLYLGTGDGGGSGDASEGHSAQGNAQDLTKLNGKILRLDVDREGPYAIPPDNPFAGATDRGRPEIYAWGFRNPWRLTWEPNEPRSLLVSDVGYGRYEEIDAVERGGNYGWRIREGAHCLDVDQPLLETTDCPAVGAGGEQLIDPVLEYTHAAVGIAVVGGYVYRGSAIAGLRGRYVFADFSKAWKTNEPVPRASLLVAEPATDTGSAWPWQRLPVAGRQLLPYFISGMGEDPAGELYVVTRGRLGPAETTGQVLRIVPG